MSTPLPTQITCLVHGQKESVGSLLHDTKLFILLAAHVFHNLHVTLRKRGARKQDPLPFENSGTIAGCSASTLSRTQGDLSAPQRSASGAPSRLRHLLPSSRLEWGVSECFGAKSNVSSSRAASSTQECARTTQPYTMCCHMHECIRDRACATAGTTCSAHKKTYRNAPRSKHTLFDVRLELFHATLLRGKLDLETVSAGNAKANPSVAT